MIKQADIGQMLDGLKDQASGAGSQLMKWYGGLNPEVRGAVVRGLAGAAVGGAAGRFLAPEDEKGRKGLSPALLGMLLGGGTAAALPLGLKMMGNGIKFKSETDRPLGLRALEAPGSFALNHPFAVGLPALAGWHNSDAFGLLAHGVRQQGGAGTGTVLQKGMNLARNTGKTLTDSNFWNQKRYWNFEPIKGKPAAGVMPLRGGGRARMATVPLALLLGLAGDKYLKGQW